MLLRSYSVSFGHTRRREGGRETQRDRQTDRQKERVYSLLGLELELDPRIVALGPYDLTASPFSTTDTQARVKENKDKKNQTHAIAYECAHLQKHQNLTHFTHEQRERGERERGEERERGKRERWKETEREREDQVLYED